MIRVLDQCAGLKIDQSFEPVLEKKGIVACHIVQTIWAVMRVDFFLDAEGTFDFLALLTVQQFVDRVGSATSTLIQNCGRPFAKENRLQLLASFKHFPLHLQEKKDGKERR